MVTATHESNEAKGQTPPYDELYELAVMLGADKHPMFKLGTRGFQFQRSIACSPKQKLLGTRPRGRAAGQGDPLRRECYHAWRAARDRAGS
jgi:hypothetical protein